MVNLPARTVNRLLKIWRENPDREACGVLVGNCRRVVQCRNVADNPDCEYEFDEAEIARLYRTHKITGVWHTHPPGLPKQPSEADIDDAHGRAEPYFVVSRDCVVEVPQ